MLNLDTSHKKCYNKKDLNYECMISFQKILFFKEDN